MMQQSGTRQSLSSNTNRRNRSPLTPSMSLPSEYIFVHEYQQNPNDNRTSKPAAKPPLRFTQYIPEERLTLRQFSQVTINSDSTTSTHPAQQQQLQIHPTSASNTINPFVYYTSQQNIQPSVNYMYHNQPQQKLLSIPSPQISPSSQNLTSVPSSFQLQHPHANGVAANQKKNTHPKYLLSHILLSSNVDNTSATALREFSRAISIHEQAKVNSHRADPLAPRLL